MITRLPAVTPAVGDRRSNAGADHPMRRATRAIAFEPGGWTPGLVDEVRSLFDSLAQEWPTRHGAETTAVVVDALGRGGPVGAGTWLELGSGTGLVTPALLGRTRRVLAVDLSLPMLLGAPADVGLRVCADGARLPVADGSVDVAVLANAFLFPAEVRRVLAPGGTLVWSNTFGDGTPIHLPVDDVVAALGDGWDAVASTHAHGSWAVARHR